MILETGHYLFRVLSSTFKTRYKIMGIESMHDALVPQVVNRIIDLLRDGLTYYSALEALMMKYGHLDCSMAYRCYARFTRNEE